MDSVRIRVEEAEALEKLQKSLEGVLNVVSCGFDFDDKVLRRFLQARDLNPKKAKDMIAAFLDWRELCHIDSLPSWDPPEEVIQGFDIHLCGHDTQGRPVIYVPVGKWTSPRDLFNLGMRDACRQFSMKVLDAILYRKYLHKTKHQNFICIVDIAGEHLMARALHELQNLQGVQDLITLFRDYEANYPETLYKAFVVNAPFPFYWGFNIIKPFLSQQTLGRISIYGDRDNTWESDMRLYLPESIIPQHLGGLGKMTSLY